MIQRKKLKVAVWKFASCDGCQLNIMSCYHDFLQLADMIDFSHFPELSSKTCQVEYDISFVEGSISTAASLKQIQEIRKHSKRLIAIGACATAGGIQALRNTGDSGAQINTISFKTNGVESLSHATPIAEHVLVDEELYGCPIEPKQLRTLLEAEIFKYLPQIFSESVCAECKRANRGCVLVKDRKPCLGPITNGGCGALCPKFQRACYGCFGPLRTANIEALKLRFYADGYDSDVVYRLLHSYNSWAPFFREVDAHERNHRASLSNPS